MRRFTFNVVAVVSLVAGSVILVAWIRSWTLCDFVGYEGRVSSSICSEDGELHVAFWKLSQGNDRGFFAEVPSTLSVGLLYRHFITQYGASAGGFAIINGQPGLTITMPHWFALAVCEIVPVWWVFRRMGRVALKRREAEGLCVKCGYDLRASPGSCPECGAVRAAVDT
jgi:hypothetical protein